MTPERALQVVNTCKGRDRITVRTAQGSTVTGRVCPLLIFRDSHVAIDVGHGRPVVADASNIVAHRPS